VSPTPAPTRASFHRRTARMTVRAQPAMSYGLSARVTEAMTLYRGTSELILDIDSEGDDFGDEDIKEDEEDKSLDTDDERERLEDEGPGLEGREDEAVPEGEQQAVPVADTIMGEPLVLDYEALRRCELAVEEDRVLSTFEVGHSFRFVLEPQRAERVSAFRQPTLITWVDPEDGRVYTDIPAYVPPVAPVQTPPSPEWSSGSLPISPSSLVVPSSIASLVATLTATISVDEDQFLEVGRSQERLETRFARRAWEGQTDAQRAALWHAIYDIQKENHDFRMQLFEERRERLELADRVARMERR
ncbi:hypothetical protein Tco_1550586, partial [Tanacetum coccineum]